MYAPLHLHALSRRYAYRAAQIRVGTRRSARSDATYVVDIRRAGHGRAGSKAGNPFVLTRCDNDRGRQIVCDAYEALLEMTLVDPRRMSAAEVAHFGLSMGHVGPTTDWDGPAVWREIHHIAAMSRERDVLLVCGCVPRRCHGESIARHADFERRWADL